MDDELELPKELDEMLGKGGIDISYDIPAVFSLKSMVHRVHHHFHSSDLGHREISDSSFRLKVRSHKYPVFGAFVGNVHVIPNTDGRSTNYRLEGLLEYRMSVLWFFAVLGFFFLLVYITHPGFWIGAFFQALGSGLTLYWTYFLGRNERDAVAEHIEASCVFLISTIQNMR